MLISTPTLKAPGIILDRFTPQDAAAVYEGWSHSQEVNRFMLRYCDDTPEKSRNYLMQLIDSYENPAFNNWAIRKNGKLAGMITLNVSKAHRRASVAFLVADGMRGSGIGYAALMAVLGYSESLSIHRVEAEVFEENIPSCRLLKKASFFCESRAVDKVVKDGKYHNILTYVLFQNKNV